MIHVIEHLSIGAYNAVIFKLKSGPQASLFGIIVLITIFTSRRPNISSFIIKRHCPYSLFLCFIPFQPRKEVN